MTHDKSHECSDKTAVYGFLFYSQHPKSSSIPTGCALIWVWYSYGSQSDRTGCDSGMMETANWPSRCVRAAIDSAEKQVRGRRFYKWITLCELQVLVICSFSSFIFDSLILFLCVFTLLLFIHLFLLLLLHFDLVTCVSSVLRLIVLGCVPLPCL